MVVVKVMRTGMLQPDVMLTSPVVRLHVVSADTGEYLCLPQQLLGGTSTTQSAAESGSSGRLRLAGGSRSSADDKEQVLVPPEAQSEVRGDWWPRLLQAAPVHRMPPVSLYQMYQVPVVYDE
jgi:hypothetical protein